MIGYPLVKLLHVLSAIIAVGFNLSYVVWLVKGKMEKDNLLFALKGIKLMDDKIANPCYIFSLLTGLLLAWMGGYNILTTGWIFYPLVLFSIMGFVGFGLYSPTLAKQIALLKEQGSNSPAYAAIDRKQTILGVILFSLALAIVVIMVLKPALPAF
jgi:uncharacterized membrane protein